MCIAQVADPLQPQKTIPKEENSFDWKLNTRDLAAQEPDLLALDKEDKVLYSHEPLCLSTQSEISLGNEDCMALANLSPNGDKGTETDFTSDYTEFGTDNCATHHICSDYN